MRALVDIVDSITGMIRFIVLAIMLVGLAFSLLTTGYIAYFSPDPEVEAEQELRLREMALQESRQAEGEALRSKREKELAKDGWGYGSAETVSKDQGERRAAERRARARQYKDDWGDSAR